MVLTALTGAVYNVLSRRYGRRCPPLQVLAIGLSAGVSALLIVTFAQGLPSLRLSTEVWMAVAYLGVIGAALTFFLWVWALARTSPTLVAITVTLNPVTTMICAALLLDEPVTFQLALGLIAVIGGIWLTNRPK